MSWEDQQAAARRLVEQAQRGIAHGRRWSLDQAATYYREQANEKSNTAKDRRLWKMLADELEQRLGRPTAGREAPPEQDGLW